MRDTTVMTNLCRFSICLFALLATAGAPLDSARAAYNCPITYTSCNANYYYSSGTCTACSSLTGSYALKDGANTNGSGSCYKTCAAAGTCTNCTLSRVAEKVYYPSGACSYALSCGAGYYGSSHGKNITTNTAGCTACTNSPSNAATWSRTGASTSATGCAVNITACNTGYSVSNNNTSAATCTLGAYAVTLDANGGTAGTTTSVTATYYAVLPAVAVAGLPKRAGYTFNGYWSAQSGGTQYIYAGGAATENKWTTAAAGTIYAQWAACGGNNYYCSGAAYNSKAAVSSGYYSTGGTDTTRTGQSQCSGAYWCSGGVQTECPAQTTGWTRNTGAGWTAFGSCNETKTGTAISAYCNA
ncbi:MAG: InlB B-repeat-containing protein, partial [Rickettsiales bacterium]|nr:InlB B-repeat-containing protein [Rickettsiales bacterium]